MENPQNQPNKKLSKDDIKTCFWISFVVAASIMSTVFGRFRYQVITFTRMIEFFLILLVAIFILSIPFCLYQKRKKEIK